MTYVYEAVLLHDPDGYQVAFPDFPGALTDGDTVEEACENAVEVLQLVIAEYIDKGNSVPKATFSDHPQLIIAAEVTDEIIAETKCMTISEASEILGVTSGRVSQLLNSGQLEPYQNGGQRMVTIASVNERLHSQHGPGRPRKNK